MASILAEFDEVGYAQMLRDEGREQGKEEGRKQGILEGKEEGEKEGRARAIVQSVNAIMNNLNVDLETACKYNDIKIEEYQSAVLIVKTRK